MTCVCRDGAPCGAVRRARTTDAMYLLDTNVVSELRKRRPHGGVWAWLERTSDAELHLAAVTIGEIQGGIELTRERDPLKAAEIESWLERVAETYNILPADARIFRQWARLMHRRSHALIEDAIIAATAQVHDLIVVSRNAKDFKDLGVRFFDPFKVTPP